MSFNNKVEMLLHHANTTTERALPLTPPAQLDSPPSPEGAATIASGADNTFVAASTTKNDSFQVSITTQPPLKTVYQRILKPFPTVTLTVAQAKNQKSSRRRSRGSPLSDDEGEDCVAEGTDSTTTNSDKDQELAMGCADVLETLSANSSNSSANGLFVEATLLRGDNGEPIPKCLDGNSIVRFEKNPWSEGVYTATFKKLKILSTSQQLQGILFRLKFTLKKYSGSSFTTVAVPDCDVVSHPVEVFSHSQYLNKKSPKPSSGSSSASVRKEFKDIVKKMDGKKVQGALYSVLQAFKEQGGSRSSVLDVVQQVFGDDAGEGKSSRVGGPSRRMSAPSSYNNPQQQQQQQQQQHQQTQPQLVIAPALTLATAAANSVDVNVSASAVEAQFLNELLSKLQIGAISLDDFVNHLVQGLGKPRASQLLAQMGLNVNFNLGIDAAPATAPSLTAFPSVLPSFPTNSAFDSSNSLAAILNALAHQQTQLAQLQAVQQSQQLGGGVNPFLQQQLQQQQQQQQQQQAQLHQQLAAAAASSSVPVMPKPRRLSSPQVAAALSPTSNSTSASSSMSASPPQSTGGLVPPLTLPSVSLPSAVTPSSASSSLSTLADAISSHLHMQPQPQTTPTPSSMSTSALTSSSLLPLTLPPLVDHMNTFATSASNSNVILPPIAATLAAVSSSSSGPLPSLFSLCSLASAIDNSGTSAAAADQPNPSRGLKRSFEAAITPTPTPASPVVSPPSPNKLARRDGDSTASSAAAAGSATSEEKTQWYWKNNSTWEPYAESVSSQLERAHKNQTPCIVVLHDVPYKMDFQSMTQQRIDNPKRWKHIRRGEEN